MSLPRILIVSRKTDIALLAREKRSTRVRRLVESRDPSVSDLLLADREHKKTLELLKRAVKKLGFKAKFVHRTDGVDSSRYDLVVTVGGDGTLLHASHRIGPTPVIAVNSSPSTSQGYLAAASSQNIMDCLSDAVKLRLPVAKLHRMALAVEGRTVSKRILNDALFCHACPASTTRYIITSGDREEEQVSSGVWVSTAAGSTSASLAAGGKVLPLRSRRLQFVVREPNSQLRKKYRLLKGFVSSGHRMKIINRLYHESRIYIDGPHELFNLRRGETAEFFISDEPLFLVGISPDRHRSGARPKKGR